MCALGGSFFSLNYPHGDINRGYVIWANYLILTFNLFNLARNSVNWLVVFFCGVSFRGCCGCLYLYCATTPRLCCSHTLSGSGSPTLTPSTSKPSATRASGRCCRAAGRWSTSTPSWSSSTTSTSSSAPRTLMSGAWEWWGRWLTEMWQPGPLPPPHL